AARVTQVAHRARPCQRRAARGDRLRRAGAGLPGPQQESPRPRLRPARRATAGAAAAPFAARHAAGGTALRLDALECRGGRRRDDHASAPVDRPARRARTVEQLERETLEFRDRVAAFIDGLISHFVLDDGKLVVAHGGMKAEYAGRASGRVREFALYGDTTGETDEFGLPVRLNWAADYRGRAMVVYGHTPVREPEWLNNTINIDTGCVFGGA